MIRCFPDPYKDELMYSLCARYAERMQYPQRFSACTELFGTLSHTRMVDRPRYLGQLIDSLPSDHDWRAETFIKEHSLFPVYEKFLSTKRASQLRRQMMEGGRGFIIMKAITGIPAPQYFRVCADCVAQDTAFYGEPYWHRIHQLYGVIVCPTHHTRLLNTQVWKRGGNAFISARQAARGLALVPQRRFNADSLAVTVAVDLEYLLTCDLRSDASWWNERYYSLLVERGLAAVTGRVWERSVQLLIRKWLETHDFGAPWNKIAIECLSKKIAQLHRYAVANPLPHVLFIRALGYSVEAFKRQVTPYYPFGCAPWPCLNPVTSHYKALLVQRCEIDMPLGRRPLGTFTCRCGFAYRRVGPDQRPEDRFTRTNHIKAYGPIWDSTFQRLLGDPRNTARFIARRLGVHVETLRYQAKRIGLKDPRLSMPRYVPKVRRRITKSMCRSRWKRLLEKFPAATRTTLYSKAGSTYSWLRRNDREWFQATLPPPVRKCYRSQLEGVWSNSDGALVNAVLRCIKETREGLKPVPITRPLIASKLGLPKASLNWPGRKFPETTALLARLMKRTPNSGVIARLHWLKGRLHQYPRPLTKRRIVHLASIGSEQSRSRKVKQLIDQILAI